MTTLQTQIPDQLLQQAQYSSIPRSARYRILNRSAVRDAGAFAYGSHAEYESHKTKVIYEVTP